MPLLSLTWASVVLLSVLIYVACTFYKKDLKRYHHIFAATTFLICALLAIVIETTLRSRGINMIVSPSQKRMPYTLEALFFYAKYITIYVGAYTLLLTVKTKAVKVTCQVLLILLFYYFYAVSVNHAGVGYFLYSDGNDACPEETSTDGRPIPLRLTPNLSSFHRDSVMFWPRVFRKFEVTPNC